MKAILFASALSLVSLPALCQKPSPLIEKPVLLERTEPEYTEEARKARIEGSVTLSGVIGTNGRLGDLVLVRPLPYGLGDKAMECVRKWRFKPATKDGVPVPVKTSVQVGFFLPRR